MLHDEVRRAREQQHISQVSLARSAGVPRSQLVAFEKGGNITLSTLQKIIDTLGIVRLEVVPASLDLAKMRRSAVEMQELALRVHDAASRLIEILEGVPAPPRNAVAPGAGAELYDGGSEITPEHTARLVRLLEEIKSARNQPPKDS